MTSDTTVFDDETPETNALPTAVTPNAGNTESAILNSLVGEGKKFKTVEDLAKSKLESDAFINRLQDEQKELRKDLEARIRTEDALAELKKDRGNQAPADSSVDVKKVVLETLEQAERDKIALKNIRQANDHIIDKCGGKKEAEAFIIKKSEELGVPVEWLKDMAARSPKALYNTLGVDATVAPPPTGMTKGDVNTAAKNKEIPLNPNASKEYYESLRKSKPSLYWTPKVQTEIFEATKKGLYK
jgi:hypothetical protein